MSQCESVLSGVYLNSLAPGTTVEVETESRRYQIEYVEGDQIRIAGHPRWCPIPTLARLHGSAHRSDGLAPGYIGCGMHLVFERMGDHIPVTTSKITDIRVSEPN